MVVCGSFCVCVFWLLKLLWSCYLTRSECEKEYMKKFEEEKFQIWKILCHIESITKDLLQQRSRQSTRKIENEGKESQKIFQLSSYLNFFFSK